MGAATLCEDLGTGRAFERIGDFVASGRLMRLEDYDRFTRDVRRPRDVGGAQRPQARSNSRNECRGAIVRGGLQLASIGLARFRWQGPATPGESE